MKTKSSLIISAILTFFAVANSQAQQVNLTLQVSMINESVHEAGVHVAGAFQGWDPSATQLSDEDGDGIYTLTLAVNSNSSFEYKFVNGNYWGADEYAPDDCGANGNRTVNTADVDLTLEAVYFGSCNVVVPEASDVNITIQVNMANQVVSADGVHIAGAFQGWDPSSTQMLDEDSDNIYSITLAVSPNSTYEYKFVNGNSWDDAENVDSDCATNGNRSLVTMDLDTILAPICYTSCSACLIYGCTDPTATNYNALADADDESCSYASGCTDETAINYDSGAVLDDASCIYPISVTIQVNMANQVVSADGIHIAGSFQDWNPSTTQMLDDDSDEIYSITLAVNPNSTYEYKFVNGNTWDDAENVDSDCATNGNRSLETMEMDTILAPVCYTACSACEEIILYDVTFKVGMINEEVSADGVHIAGAFQGWNPGSTELTDVDNDGVYEITLSIESGNYEYKFVNGAAWGLDEPVPSACNVGGNRQIEIMSDMTVQYCFGQCDEMCLINPDAAEITFAVNMQSVEVDASGVWLMGSFTDAQWQDGRIQMTEDITMSGVYTATVLVSGSAEFQYKFANGEPISGTEFEHGENADFETSGCGVSNGIGGWNRVFVRSGMVESAGTYCYESCSLCPGVISPSSQTIEITSGWSMFSTYMNAENMNMTSVLEPILADVLIVKNYLGEAYLPEWNFNAIGDLLIGQGYLIKTTQEASFSISGTYALPEENPIYLDAGWNMVGYLRLEPADVEAVFGSIIQSGNLLIVKNYLGGAYLPEWGFDGVGMMMPGKGYQVKIIEEDVLQYLSSDEEYRLSTNEVDNSKLNYFQHASITDANMQIVIPTSAWGKLPNHGDELAAFDTNGNLVGSAKFSTPVTVLTLWGNDETTEAKDGLVQGENLTFKLWNASNNTEHSLKSAVTYHTNDIFVVASITTEKPVALNENKISLMPNPARENTNLSFFIEKENLVKISIYTMLGELKEVISESVLEAGMHTIKLNTSNLRAGSYFCKITVGGQGAVKSMVILK